MIIWIWYSIVEYKFEYKSYGDQSINITPDLQFLKDARSVSFRSELFTSYIWTIFKQRNLFS